jgi:beta-hydroxyacyl-ACP dehydratase FabZ
MMVIEQKEIMEIIPHRYPFLLVDRITSFEKNKRAVGIKNVSINEAFFQGHFPGNPIMPGVLMIEAMAQVSGVLVLKSVEMCGKKEVYFAAIREARFKKVVTPGDQLVIEIDLVAIKRNLCFCKGKITVDGVLAVEAELVATI